MLLFDCLGGFLATTYLWFAFWLVHLLVLTLQVVYGIVFIWLWPISPRRYFKAMGYFHHLTTLALVTLSPFWWVKRFRREGEKRRINFPPGTILMSNHLCYVDAWMIASQIFPRHVTFVAQGALWKMPVLGQVMTLSGHIPVKFYKDKEDNNKVKVANREALTSKSENTIKNGGRLVVFPEGSLSRTGHLKEFKIGFFKTSVKLKCPILPVAMCGNHGLFPPGKQYAFAHPGRVQITFGDLIYPEEDETPEELRDRVKVAINHLQAELPRYKKFMENQPADIQVV